MGEIGLGTRGGRGGEEEEEEEEEEVAVSFKFKLWSETCDLFPDTSLNAAGFGRINPGGRTLSCWSCFCLRVSVRRFNQ